MGLATNPHFDVISLPGNVGLREGLVHGSETLRFIRGYNVDCAITGASAFDEIGVRAALPPAAEVYNAMADEAERTIVVADRPKLGKMSLRLIVLWNADTMPVTDTTPPDTMRQPLVGKCAEIVIAEIENG